VSDTPPNNVPLRLSSFVGRQRELQHVRELLARTRILTLTGPGGSGKTRLALEVAAESLLAGEYADGVWWVGLESLADGSLVLQSIAAALGLREQVSRPLEQIVSEHVRARQMLLLLDNCEHLLRACESVVERLLGIAPHLRVMATSREPLGIAGEVIWPVPPLSLETQREPADAGVAHFSLAKQSEAVRLFVERATESLPTFTWTDKNAKVISEICARLEGIPLALELAAARVRVLTLKQIAERLDASLGLLIRGSRNVPVPRHRTLRAAIDWSYNLLEQPERILFRRLSVFAGGFTLAAAEQTCGVSQVETSEVLDLLSRLVDKSLVTADLLQHGEARYHLLETIRQYAREQLVEAGESETLRQRHAQFFVTLAEVAEWQLLGPEQSYWLNRFEQEQDNLRAALDWATHDDGDALGLRLAGALWRYWISRDHFQEGRAWLSRFLAREAAVIDKPARAKALLGATALAVPQGDYETARALGEESLGLYRELADPRGIGLCLFALAIVAAERGDEAGACALLEDSLGLWREMGDQRGIATALYNLGERARYRRDYRRAAELYEECLEIYDRTHDVGGQALAKRNLALVAQHENDTALAARLCAESLALWQVLGNKTQMSLCLDAFASVISARGDFERAACLMAAAKALRDEMGLALEKVDRVELDRIVTRVRAALDEKTFAKAWAQGRAMTLEQAVESVSKES
jgi:non-specific serine/threonine protein kinase